MTASSAIPPGPPPSSPPSPLASAAEAPSVPAGGGMSGLASGAPPGLTRLKEIPLSPTHQAMLDMAASVAGGPPPCRLRMQAEARDLLAMAQLPGGRLRVHWLDLSFGLRAKVTLRCPVPCLSDPAGDLQIAPAAVLGLIYLPEAMVFPQPGYAFVRILEPRGVWLGNASNDENQALCLAASFPPGVRLKEIVLMSYGSLSMRTALLDKFDSAGVMNPAAAEWWQRNAHRVPLSREPFLTKDSSHEP